MNQEGYGNIESTMYQQMVPMPNAEGEVGEEVAAEDLTEGEGEEEAKEEAEEEEMDHLVAVEMAMAGVREGDEVILRPVVGKSDRGTSPFHLVDPEMSAATK